jgi:hypothetical protein
MNVKFCTRTQYKHKNISFMKVLFIFCKLQIMSTMQDLEDIPALTWWEFVVVELYFNLHRNLSPNCKFINLEFLLVWHYRMKNLKGSRHLFSPYLLAATSNILQLAFVILFRYQLWNSQKWLDFVLFLQTLAFVFGECGRDISQDGYYGVQRF